MGDHVPPSCKMATSLKLLTYFLSEISIRNRIEEEQNNCRITLNLVLPILGLPLQQKVEN